MKNLEEVKWAVENCRHVADKILCPQCPYKEAGGACHSQLKQDILAFLRLLEF